MYWNSLSTRLWRHKFRTKPYLSNQAVFSTYPKTRDKSLNILRTKRAFKMKQKSFFIILERYHYSKQKNFFFGSWESDFIIPRVLITPEFWIYSGNKSKMFLNSGETLKNKIRSECIWSETWILFLALNNVYFLRVFGKSLRNNAPPTILSSSPPTFPRISPTLFTLVRHPRWHINHLTHTGTPTTLPTLSCHPS